MWVIGLSIIGLISLAFIARIAYNEDMDRPYRLITLITLVACFILGCIVAFGRAADITLAKLVQSAFGITVMVAAIVIPLMLLLTYIVRLKPKDSYPNSDNRAYRSGRA